MTVARVDLDFTEQEPIPSAAIERANELMATGRLFRYGETTAGEADAALLESAFAALVGRSYCVGFNSCGASMAAALIAAGVAAGDKVLMNAFTLAPVPGAIAHAGAEPLFVGIDDALHIDVDDLGRAIESSGSRWLLLSYMRGHIPDVDDVLRVCDDHGVTVIEDCAHTMGGAWRDRPTGTFGVAGCFSTQSFKHVNSGEGGLLVTDDEDVAARAVLLSGSYMLYEQHGARPSAEVFERHRYTTPNFSMRMTAFAAALIRPQLAELDRRAADWNERYRALEEGLTTIDGLGILPRHRDEGYVGSSIQFVVERGDPATLVREAAALGVPVKWFGAEEPAGFTSRFDHWRYAPEQQLLRTRDILARLCDMRIPLSMTPSHVDQILAVLRSAAAAATAS